MCIKVSHLLYIYGYIEFQQQLEYAKDIIFMLSEPTMQAKVSGAVAHTHVFHHDD